jgi:hypothetical protein
MNKYIIKWDAGYGENYEIVEAESIQEADEAAYQICLEEMQMNMEYGVVGEATNELIEEYIG